MLEYPSPFATDVLVSDGILSQGLALSRKQVPETVENIYNYFNVGSCNCKYIVPSNGIAVIYDFLEKFPHSPVH